MLYNVLLTRSFVEYFPPSNKAFFKFFSLFFLRENMAISRKKQLVFKEY